VKPPGSWDLEISLDLDAVSATCPFCHIVLVEADTQVTPIRAWPRTRRGPGRRGLDLQRLRGPETSAYNADYAHAGIVITASTGDNGYGGGSQTPATTPGSSPSAARN
jgi:hypothetical protein